MMTIRIQREGGDISTLAIRTGGIKAKAYRQGGILCRMYQEVRSSLDIPYLEIHPTTIWVLVGQSSDNGVYSNTTWNVD